MNGWLILLALAVLAATAHLASLRCRPWTSCKGVQPQRRDPRPGVPVNVWHLPGLRRPGPQAGPGVRVLQPRRARRMTAAQANHKITGEPRS